MNEFDSNNFLKEIAKIPFHYNENKIIFDNIIQSYLELYDKNKEIQNLIWNFKKYFNDTWDAFLKNKMLNYNGLKKFQRSNSYIENYNKRIKFKLGKLII